MHLVAEVRHVGEPVDDEPGDPPLEGVQPRPLVKLDVVGRPGILAINDEAEAFEAALAGVIEFAFGDAAVVARLDEAIAVGEEAEVDVGLVELGQRASGGAEAHRLEVLHADGGEAQLATDEQDGLAVGAEVAGGAADEDGWHGGAPWRRGSRDCPRWHSLDYGRGAAATQCAEAISVA